MSAPDPENAMLPDAATLLGLDLPAECRAGVRDALEALEAHWRLVENGAATADRA